MYLISYYNTYRDLYRFFPSIENIRRPTPKPLTPKRRKQLKRVGKLK